MEQRWMCVWWTEQGPLTSEPQLWHDQAAAERSAALHEARRQRSHPDGARAWCRAVQVEVPAEAPQVGQQRLETL